MDRSFGRKRTYTVTDLTLYIGALLEEDALLQSIQIVGELSNVTHARSGHLYFTLKDHTSQLKAVMWRSSADKLPFRPKDGLEVVVRGRVAIYEAGGLYQLYADAMAEMGQGAQAQQFDLLKEQLAAEGLFDVAHKKPIPRFPQKIGIVTSADAAALRDILKVLARRYPLVSVLIAPTLVQGESAPPQIIAALRWLDSRNDIDTILLARGGGSAEDLSAFNDEALARAVFAAQHPIISGVGHEVDFTIVDFVADLRAPTPSAAAELATPDSAELLSKIRRDQNQLRITLAKQLTRHQSQLNALARTLRTFAPQSRLQSHTQRLDDLENRLNRAIQQRLQNRQTELKLISTQLQALNPLATLGRGYAIVHHPTNGVIQSVQSVAIGDNLSIQLGDGRFSVVVTAKEGIESD